MPFKFVRTVIPDIGTTGRFIDKPWMYVEAAPAGADLHVNAASRATRRGRRPVWFSRRCRPASCTWSIPVFVDSTDTLAQLMYVRSDNCGATFTRPKQLNQGDAAGQRGRHRQAAELDLATGVHRVAPGPDADRARRRTPSSASFPTTTADLERPDCHRGDLPLRSGHDHGVVPHDRLPLDDRRRHRPRLRRVGRPRPTACSNGQCNPEGAARIRIATSTDGVNWTESAPVPSATPEHQILPVDCLHGGPAGVGVARLQRGRLAGVRTLRQRGAGACPSPGIRHTGRRARVDGTCRAPRRSFDQPTLISDTSGASAFANGQRVATQLQWNAVNRRWARRAPSPSTATTSTSPRCRTCRPIPQRVDRRGCPTTRPSIATALGPAPRMPLLLLAWTDNRDMRTGPDVDIPRGTTRTTRSPQPQPVPFVHRPG